MTTILASDLTDLATLRPHARVAEVVTRGGAPALRLDGLLLFPELDLADAHVEVEIAADESAYPGVAFHAAGQTDFELAYAQPHTSGQWDALQYDPVFRGSNTWQVYHGPGYQQAAEIPAGQWIPLRLDVCGGQACLSAGGQPPLAVGRLAHGHRSGSLGLWSHRPAYFRDLKVSTCDALPAPVPALPRPGEHVIAEWRLEGSGRIVCEPHGILNINRYLPPSAEPARLGRLFQLEQDGEVELAFGFSDRLILRLDGQTVFEGENTFKGFASREERGYVEPGQYTVKERLSAGPHVLSAELRATEPFGWGLHVATRGLVLQPIHLTPAP